MVEPLQRERVGRLMDINFKAHLEQFYPDNKRITESFILEYESQWKLRSEGDLVEAMQKYRATEKRRYLPTVWDLMPLVPRSYIGREQEKWVFVKVWNNWLTTYVLNYGWKSAVEAASELPKTRKLLDLMGINETSPEYSSVPDWYAEFLRIIHHEGNPAKAYKFAGNNCPIEENRYSYKSQAEWFSRGTQREQCRYFLPACLKFVKQEKEAETVDESLGF